MRRKAFKGPLVRTVRAKRRRPLCDWWSKPKAEYRQCGGCIILTEPRQVTAARKSSIRSQSFSRKSNTKKYVYFNDEDDANETKYLEEPPSTLLTFDSVRDIHIHGSALWRGNFLRVCSVHSVHFLRHDYA